MCDSDIVVAPPSTILDLEKSGHVIKLSGVIFGSVKIAVMVKQGAILPNISSKDELKWAILDSKKIIFNQASSGQYIKLMIESMGIYNEILKKTLRTKTGAEVIEYLDGSNSFNEIGFSQATEVQLKINEGWGVKFVGILPREIEHISTYKSALLVSSTNKNEAHELLNFMSTDEAKSICSSTGLF
jgi:molybdate transport system substrate-binding protein